MDQIKERIVTLEELFLQPLQPIQYLVEGLLTPGLYILGGAPKIGKSWMCLQLGLAICSGENFLGCQIRPSEVLYFCLEDSSNRIHRRAAELTNSAPKGFYLCGQAAPLGAGFEEQLLSILQRQPAIRLVIVDTLQKIRSSRSGNAYAQDYQEMAALKNLADQCGICLLAVHHLRKMPDDDPMNRLSGTTGLSGCADGTLILARDRRSSNAVLTVTGRDVEDQELELSFSGGRWEAAENSDSQQNIVLNSVAQLLAGQHEFRGSATELARRLSAEAGVSLTSSSLSKQLRQQQDKLAAMGIQISSTRTSENRTLHLIQQ
ncbi:MAG: AAA family ATPase [Oscillospiraceae bacterium]|jgi:replicative DNA helicase|nr:AAA family ATPase [Oscillospiraceae bacterium]